jgi:hypothetical protein
MNRIFITGDVHGTHDWQKLFDFNFDSFDKSDVMIIAGDWGHIWGGISSTTDKYQKTKLQALNYSFFVVLGNHENYDRIYALPTKEAYGNTVWYEPEFPDIVYAQRGLVYNINGKKFWCFGGAFSVDVEYRIPHRSWWSQELPTQEEMDIGLQNLQNNEIDYIVTHTCPERFEPREKWVSFLTKEQVDKSLEKYFDRVWELKCDEIDGWFSGHYHIDKSEPNGIYHHLYNSIIEICEENYEEV